MWDYTTGFVHLTGIWKALGNSKADIVKLCSTNLELELEGVIKRIRGGYLKIQGTWVPYELGRALAKRTCWPLRHAMVSVFGPDFPSECLQPGMPGYGTLSLNDDDDADPKKKRKRKAQQSVSVTGLKRPARGQASTKAEPMPLTVAQAEKRRRMEGAFSHPPALPKERPTRKAAKPKRYVEEDEGDEEDFDEANEIDSQSSTSVVSDVSEIVEVPISNGFTPSKIEILDLLRASRSLQQLSTGHQSFDKESAGGIFDVRGTMFRWDGGMEGRSGLTRIINVPERTQQSPHDASTEVHDGEPELEDDKGRQSSPDSVSLVGSQYGLDYNPRMASASVSPAQVRVYPAVAHRQVDGKSPFTSAAWATPQPAFFGVNGRPMPTFGFPNTPQPASNVHRGSASIASTSVEHEPSCATPPERTRTPDFQYFGPQSSLALQQAMTK
ncbi:hypothetical protein BCR37DRAFT_382716 [Protomyces lactucae-debilis]|uniref:HTH APSES-type domain-containing protein n=1 Tax=Protomyces lactucae-debilis TaxID=2754530 RepID=A0A1Y2F1Q3_PROLT|nr:uncharacterized protein BCR37DRAFT_382716 [Protomyces lactucae-debilis]ORY77811.1 hypothetical protein BCR37DRAFT_382716 [Protomyces lactucae-debilis]